MSVKNPGHFSRCQYYSNVRQGYCRPEQKNKKNIAHLKINKSVIKNFQKRTVLNKTIVLKKQNPDQSSKVMNVVHMSSWLLVSKQGVLLDIVQAISSGDQTFFEKLLNTFTGNINASITENQGETLLWHALNQKNYHAAALLIQKGAGLKQKLSAALDAELKNKIKKDFFSNVYYYGLEGEDFFCETILRDYENSLVYAIASHYYPKDPAALDLLLRNPSLINMSVLKVFIRSGDLSAFKKVLGPFLKLSKSQDDQIANLLKYALGDFHFSLMGFNFDYIVNRLEIIKLILTFNPIIIGVLNSYGMTCFETAQYLQDYLPVQAAADFEQVFNKIFEDPTRFHEIWGIQRLLINCLAETLTLSGHLSNVEIAAYPSVAKHFKESFSGFLRITSFPNDVVFVTPSKKFTVDNCLNMINEKKILKFFTGWTGGDDEGHGINGVIYDKYLMVCNRGDGSTKKTSGICIYKIQQNQVIKKVVQLFLERSNATKKFIISGLLNHPQISFIKHISGKEQRVRNCVWLSEKMGVYASFIALILKKGCSVEKSSDLAKLLYKKWSEFDRLNLVKAYVEHPYHKRNFSGNVNDGIEYKKMVKAIMTRTPKRLLSRCCDLILNSLQNPNIKASLGQQYEQLTTGLKGTQLKALLEERNTPRVLSLVEQFPEVNFKLLFFGDSFLHLACKYNNLELAQALIKKGANPNVVNAFSTSPLDAVFVKGEKSKELVQLLIEVTDLNALSDLGSFPFFSAIKCGNEYAVQAMLKKGYDLNKTKSDGESAFHHAAISQSEHLSKQILSLCPNIEMSTKMGETLLIWATKHNVVHGVKNLLALGANANAKTKGNLTPINYITYDTQLEVCKLLLAKGADINNIPDNVMFSQLMLLIKGRMPNLVEYILQNTEVDVDVRTNVGETALTLAEAGGMANVTRLLLNKVQNNSCENVTLR